MSVYRYKAIKITGEKIEGTYTANSLLEVNDMLRQNNCYPLKIEEIIEGKEIKLSVFNNIKTKDMAVFCRQFYTMLHAGVTIVNSLDILKEQTENKRLKAIILNIYDEVQKGLTFSEALRKNSDYFPEIFINMIEVGEVSGNLDSIMEKMAYHFEKENKINNKIKTAMIYPIILSIIAIFVVIFLLTFVMPTFVGMFQSAGIELPLPTKILLSISSLIKNLWYIMLLIIVLAFYGFSKYLKTNNGRYFFDNLKLNIPVIKSNTEKIISARFTRTLSTLLSSGISLILALEIVAKVVGNKVVYDEILKIREEVRKGINLSEPVKRIGVFPPIVSNMIKVGEESGSLDEILDKTANFLDEEVDASLTKMTTLLEPLMIVIMALVVGFIVIAMVMPMFEMMNTIQL